MPNALVLDAGPEWTSSTLGLDPGAHVAVFADYQPDIVGVEGRLAGLELRDALVAFRAGPQVSIVLLFRKPLAGSVVAQVLETGTGGLNLGACRVESDEVITTHSRGMTSAHPVTRDKSIEDSGAPMAAIHFFDARGLHTTVTGAEHLVRGKAAKLDAEGLLYASTPIPWGRQRMDEFDQQERVGRWPSNVVLVHGPACSESCEPTCPIKILGEASRFFPRFKDDGELRAWVTRLVSPY